MRGRLSEVCLFFVGLRAALEIMYDGTVCDVVIISAADGQKACVNNAYAMKNKHNAKNVVS